MAKVSKKRWLPWIMILPVILIRGITTVYPVFMTFINSFRNLNVIQGGKGEFIGLQNYARMLSDEKIATSLGFTLIFTMVSMIFHIILGIVLALILNMKFKGKKFLRTIVLIPWAMPMIVAGRAARWGFNGQYGFVNDLIGRFVENFHYDWLIDVDSARIAVIIVDLWKDIPYFAILVLAALQYISGDIYEAAKIDGANAVRAFFSITLPNIAKTVLSISIFFTMWRVTNFELVYALTSGGPHDGTAVLAFKIFQWLITAMVALIILIPIYWIFISSIKPNEDLFTIPIEWIPKHFTLKSYKTLIDQVGIIQQIGCTMLITIPTLIVSTIICVLAAFAFERFSTPKLSLAYGMIVFSALIPAIVTARPLYDFFKKLKLVDTYPGLIILYTSALIPFSILILRNYLSGIPVDIEEAAEIDGADLGQKIFYVIIPLLKPAIATICIINFINCLNEFFIPLFFSQKISVLTVGISTLPRANAYDVPWDLLSAMGCVILLPIIVFVMIFEEKIMDGIMAGGVKS